ncbi:MAG: hypothetical protein OXC31_13455, partial [Spirochaetaceae bacterium]|nr:hypothetical protein [Spirochaetaceae bacterium]
MNVDPRLERSPHPKTPRNQNDVLHPSPRLRKLRRPERGRVTPETHPRARRKATGFSTPVDSVDSRLDRVVVQNRTTI